MLEHHADLLAVHVDVAFGIGDRLSLEQNLAARRHFKQVQGAQEGRFSGAGRPDDRHYLALTDRRVNMV